MKQLKFVTVYKIIRSPLALTLLIIGGAALFLFGPVFRGDVPLPTRSIPGIFWGAPNQPAQSSIFRDRIVQAYPYHLFAAKTIQAGHLPRWNNLIFNGTTFLANGQAGILSLFKLPFWWLPPTLSYIIVTLLQSVVAGVGLFLLGRKLGWKPAAGVIAGLALTLSAPFVMRLTVTTMSAVIACLPFTWWSILKLHEQLTWLRMATVAALIAVMIFAGHVQLAAFSLGFAALWSLIWWRREQWVRRLIMFALAFSLGLGLTAGQFMPVKEALDQAYRQPTHRAWSAVLNPKRLFAVNIKQAASLATTVDQNALGDEAHYRGPGNYLEGNLCIGPLALLFIVASCLAWRKRWWRWLTATAIMIGGLYVFPGWWDVVGKIAPWITVTPVWRTSFMFVFALSIMAGIGANELFQRRLSRWAWPLVGVMAVTMLWQWWGILPFAPRATLFPQNALLDRAVAETRDGTTLWTPNGTLDQFMPYDIPVAMGYDSVYPRQYLELWSANAQLRQRNQLHVKDPSPQLLSVAGANLMLTSDPVPAGWTTIMTSGYWMLAKKDNVIPPIHTVKKVMPELDPAELSKIDISTSALVNGFIPSIDPDAKSDIKFITYNKSTLTPLVGITTDKQTLLVTNLQYYPGWQAWSAQAGVTPKKLSMTIANNTFIGVVIPPGYHEIEFRYVPRSYVIGLWLSILSLVLLVVGGWIVPKVRR